MKLFCKLWVVLVMLFAQSVFASKTYVGEINKFNYGDSKILIDDQMYSLQLDTVILDQQGNTVNRTVLQAGEKISFVAFWDVNKMLISSITVLPSTANIENYR